MKNVKSSSRSTSPQRAPRKGPSRIVKILFVTKDLLRGCFKLGSPASRLLCTSMRCGQHWLVHVRPQQFLATCAYGSRGRSGLTSSSGATPSSDAVGGGSLNFCHSLPLKKKYLSPSGVVWCTKEMNCNEFIGSDLNKKVAR